MWDNFSAAWCKTMHKHTTWPMHGRYICLDCGREYAVVWTESATPEPEPAPPAARVQKTLDVRGAFDAMKQYFRGAIT
jgi:hypothetical protein